MESGAGARDADARREARERRQAKVLARSNERLAALQSAFGARSEDAPEPAAAEEAPAAFPATAATPQATVEEAPLDTTTTTTSSSTLRQRHVQAPHDQQPPLAQAQPAMAPPPADSPARPVQAATAVRSVGFQTEPFLQAAAALLLFLIAVVAPATASSVGGT
jgi:hypothetical protein